MLTDFLTESVFRKARVAPGSQDHHGRRAGSVYAGAVGAVSCGHRSVPMEGERMAVRLFAFLGSALAAGLIAFAFTYPADCQIDCGGAASCAGQKMDYGCKTWLRTTP